MTAQIVKPKEQKREDKAKVIASSRQVYRIINSDVFYVESETEDDLYYYVMFDTDGCEWCSCWDYSARQVRCKHLIAVAYAIKWGVVTDTDKLPPLAKRDNRPKP